MQPDQVGGEHQLGEAVRTGEDHHGDYGQRHGVDGEPAVAHAVGAATVRAVGPGEIERHVEQREWQDVAEHGGVACAREEGAQEQVDGGPDDREGARGWLQRRRIARKLDRVRGARVRSGGEGSQG